MKERTYRIEIQMDDSLTGLVGTNLQKAMELASTTVQKKLPESIRVTDGVPTPVPARARIRIIDEIHNAKVLDLIVLDGEWVPF